jgi:hypothetical protein
MAYTTAGVIEPWDFNRIAWGGNTQSYTNSINNLAYVWGVGSGIRGYGQPVSGFAPVASGSTVTAAQWASLVYGVNKALAHQSGAGAQLATGSNIGITSGATISAFANVVTAVSSINSNPLLWTAQGATTTGVLYWTSLSAATFAAFTQVWTRTITFASGDAARYFFNAGGQINWSFNAQNINGTARSGDVVTVFNSYLTGGNIMNIRGSGRTGTGGTATVNSVGYANLTTTVSLASSVTSTVSTYGGDVGNVNIRSNGLQGSNGDTGSVITLQFGYTSAQEGGDWNSAINANVGVRIDIVSPETTYLDAYALPTIA